MRILVLLVVVGCGGAKPAPAAPPPPSDPIPKTAGPSCAKLAEHLGTLADRDPTQSAKSDDAMRARCEADAWSDEARNCFGTAQSQPEIDGCKGMLTARQRQALAPPRDETPTIDTEDKIKPAHGTRGPVRKGKTSDPCEGGQ